jgi:protein-S-isoprenylcysteine O-methyltransferase Ste14
MYFYSTIVAITWLVFLVVWFISAFGAKKTIRNNRWSWGIGIRIAAFIIVVLLLKFSLINPHSLVAVIAYLAITNPLVNALGALLCILGVALAIWARFYLGRNWGMPMSVKENTALVTTGPYKYIRHPIYTGMLVALIGTSLVLGLIWLIVFIIVIAYFLYSAYAEERLMLKEFPNDYPAYKKRTKMLIPFIF